MFKHSYFPYTSSGEYQSLHEKFRELSSIEITRQPEAFIVSGLEYQYEIHNPHNHFVDQPFRTLLLLFWLIQTNEQDHSLS